MDTLAWLPSYLQKPLFPFASTTSCHQLSYNYYILWWHSNLYCFTHSAHLSEWFQSLLFYPIMHILVNMSKALTSQGSDREFSLVLLMSPCFHNSLGVTSKSTVKHLFWSKANLPTCCLLPSSSLGFDLWQLIWISTCMVCHFGIHHLWLTSSNNYTSNIQRFIVMEHALQK